MLPDLQPVSILTAALLSSQGSGDIGSILIEALRLQDTDCPVIPTSLAGSLRCYVSAGKQYSPKTCINPGAQSLLLTVMSLLLLHKGT